MLSIIRSHLRLKRRIQLWYHPAYIPKIKLMASYERYSLKRPKKILASLRQKYLVFSKEIHQAQAASWKDLELFHDPEYLRDTTQKRKSFLPLGIQLDDEEQESYLESQRYMVGGTLACAKAILNKKCKIAVNLGGGQHHAESAYGTGFCLYNDIAVAIRFLRKNAFQKRILIIDLDYHQGNGNMLGLKDDALTFHYSLQGHEWKNIANPNVFQLNLPLHASDNEYLLTLKETLTKYFDEVSPDLIFYLAGNDVLKNDHFGECHLTLEGLFARDRFVLDLCQKKKLPQIITMGGGYGEKAWIGSYNLIVYLLTSKLPKFHKEKMVPSEKYYARIAKHMETSLLGRDTSFELSEEDFFPGLQKKNSRKAFGVYSKSGVDMVLERYGLKKKLALRGHKKLHIEMETENDGGHLFRVHSEIASKTYLIAEAKLSEQRRSFPGLGNLRFLRIDWLLAQDPTKKFSDERVALPGQSYPGLGLSADILNLFIQACLRLKFDGISHVPTHFHIALKTCRNFQYLDPVTEGRLMALKSFLLSYSLSKASLLAEEKRIVDFNGESIWPFEGEIILPVSAKLKKYFDSKNYSEEVRKSYQNSFAEQWRIY